MNLETLLDRIAQLTAFAPNTDDYKWEVIATLNEQYRELYTMRPWSFSIRHVGIPSVGQHQCTADCHADSLYLENLSTMPSQAYEGAHLTLTGTNSGTYLVTFVDTDNSRVYLQREDGLSTFLVGETDVDVVLEQDVLTLPPTCSQVLDVHHMNNDIPYQVVNVTRDEFYSSLYATYPGIWTESDLPVDIQPPTSNEFSVSAVSTTPGKGWPQGTYTFYMAYNWLHMDGPWSDGVQVTIGVDEVPQFTTINTTWNRQYGLRKKVFVRSDGGTLPEEECVRDLSSYIDTTDPVETGLPYFIIRPSDTTTAWPSSLPYNTQWYLTLARASSPTYYTRLELLSSPIDTGYYRVRYVSEPEPLLEDYDTVQGPREVSQYLVYKTAEALLLRHEQFTAADLWNKRAQELLTRLEARYLKQRDAFYVKGNFRVSTSGNYYAPVNFKG